MAAKASAAQTENTHLRLRKTRMGQKQVKPYDRLEATDFELDDVRDDTDERASNSSGEAIPIESDLENITDTTQLLPKEEVLEELIENRDVGSPESCVSIALQIFFPFLVAGFGMVGAGLVLDIVQHWSVFVQVSELFILVPALLGLKGNLEMTLASRLSTHANLGNMDTKEDSISMISGNLALVQCQGIVVGFVASFVAILMGFVPEGKWDPHHALLLCAASIVTASIASFVLGVIMILVILLSRRCHINPDNVATPIAASLGDLTTLALLSFFAQLLYDDMGKDRWLAPTIIGCYLLFVPLCVYLAYRNEHTAKVLLTGWTPVLIAMSISSLGGMILDYAVTKFHGIAVFQPVMNGVGGNLVAVQASRISTHLHGSSSLGTLPESDSQVCISPWGVFFGASVHARTAQILVLLVVPGHLLFTYTISFLQAGHTSPTPAFLCVYCFAAVLQVYILLHVAHCLIHWMWTKGTDPDNSAIPYLTALGDLLGTGLLAVAFEILYLAGDKDGDVGD